MTRNTQGRLGGTFALCFLAVSACYGEGPSTEAWDDPETIGAVSQAVNASAACDDPSAATMLGTAGDDYLLGTPGDDVIFGLDGNDFIDGKGGNDILCGGSGADAIHGGTGDDVIHGGAGYNWLQGGDGDDAVFGGDDGNELQGNAGDDTLEGGAGNDTMYGGDGSDVLRGGAGDDDMLGNDGNDRLFGDADEDWMVGGEGSDCLDGGAADDSVFGGGGDDCVSGGDGVDQLVCEDGGDVYAQGEWHFGSCETSGSCDCEPCSAGYQDCNNALVDGCETAITTPSDCGACGMACPTVPNGAATCTDGVCGLSCDPGFSGPQCQYPCEPDPCKDACVNAVPEGNGCLDPVLCAGGEICVGGRPTLVSVIDSAGGTLSGFNGTFTLEIPPGALSVPTEISVKPDGFAVDGHLVPTFALEPHGLEFDVPATITLRYKPAFIHQDADEDLIAMVKFSSDGSKTVLKSTINAANDTISAPLSSFSWVSAAAIYCNFAQPHAVQMVPGQVDMFGGQVTTLSTVLRNRIGAVLPSQPANWSSSDPAVVSVTTGGTTSSITAGNSGVAVVGAAVSSCVFLPIPIGSLPGNFLEAFYKALINELPAWNEQVLELIVPITVGGAALVSVEDATCASLACPDDNNICTADCTSGVCGHTARPDGTPCPADVGLLAGCTADICQAGTCAHPLDPVCAIVLCLLSGICSP